MRRVREQYLFIHSKHRNHGVPYDFHVKIGEGLLTCGASQRFRLSLLAFNSVYDWYSVGADTNQFQVSGVVKTIKPGSYPYAALAKAWAEAATGTTVKISFDPFTNQFSWSSANVFTLVGGTAWRHYGLPDATSVVVPVFDGVQYSYTGRIVKAASIDHICVEVPTLHPYGAGGFNLDNIGGRGELLPSRIMSIISCAPEPFTRITYSNPTDEYGIFVVEKKITDLVIRLVDFDGVPIEKLGECFLTLKVETFEDEVDANAKLLADSRDYLQMLVLNKALKP